MPPLGSGPAAGPPQQARVTGEPSAEAGAADLALVESQRPSSQPESIVPLPIAENGAQPVALADVPVGLANGQRAPSFSVSLLDGRPVSDADLRAQEKPYILYFFATW